MKTLLLALLFATPALAQKAGPPGRYVVVNPTPEFSRNIMLLDTATGKTWIACTSSDGDLNWCAMTRSESGTKPPADITGATQKAADEMKLARARAAAAIDAD